MLEDLVLQPLFSSLDNGIEQSFIPQPEKNITEKASLVITDRCQRYQQRLLHWKSQGFGDVQNGFASDSAANNMQLQSINAIIRKRKEKLKFRSAKHLSYIGDQIVKPQSFSHSPKKIELNANAFNFISQFELSLNKN